MEVRMGVEEMKAKEMGVKDRLKMLLDREFVSQADLARATGVSADSISRYLNGTRHPRRPFLKKVASLFGVSVYWLVFGEEERRVGFSTMKNAILKLDGLTYPEMWVLLKIIVYTF